MSENKVLAPKQNLNNNKAVLKLQFQNHVS